MIHIGASQYNIALLPNWQAFTSKIEEHVSYAKAKGAQLLLLPEYAGIECVTHSTPNDLALFKNTQAQLARYLEFFSELSKRYNIYIQPGTILVESNSNLFYNRAYFFAPNGSYGYQDKLQLVQDEKEDSLLLQGTEQTVFETSLGLVGIAICYDSEFPELVRNLCLQGATLILVPSFTPSLASFHRVFYSCRARAIENQCYVLMACAIGNTQIGAETHHLIGQANLFSPIDDGFTDDGIAAQGEINEEATIFADIDHDKIETVRKQGQVLNFYDNKNNMDQKRNIEIKFLSIS